MFKMFLRTSISCLLANTNSGTPSRREFCIIFTERKWKLFVDMTWQKRGWFSITKCLVRFLKPLLVRGIDNINHRMGFLIILESERTMLAMTRQAAAENLPCPTETGVLPDHRDPRNSNGHFECQFDRLEENDDVWEAEAALEKLLWFEKQLRLKIHPK